MIMKILIGLILTVCSTTLMAEQIATVNLNRAWGLLIGDEVVLQIVLPVTVDKIDVTSLPQTDKRYGTWLYLKSLTSSDKNISLTFQVVNVPINTTEVQTPEFNFRQLNDEWIVVPESSFIIGSLLAEHEAAVAINIELKQDHKPTLIDTMESEKNIKIFSFLTLLFSLVLLAWHLGWRPKNRQPFAHAVHQLTRMKWSRTKQQNQATRILHAAFNQTAGTIVVYSELSQLINQVPWLQPLEQEIAQFYALSANHFFTKAAEQEPDLRIVMKLAKACRAKEKLA